jgi:hypothetical protein
MENIEKKEWGMLPSPHSFKLKIIFYLQRCILYTSDLRGYRYSLPAFVL